MSPFPFDPSYCDKNRHPTYRSTSTAAKIADPPTLLVVDDDPRFRELASRALSEHGYTVLQANGAAEALRLVAATPIDLLMTDFTMPGANGLELARQFRTLHPTTPVLLVSGTVPVPEAKVDELGRFAVLEKSPSFDEILRKVHVLLNEVAPLPFRACPRPIATEQKAAAH